jgi:oligoribonuclease
MKYVSIDIETTGINREKCQVLSIGAVIEDTNNPLPIKDLPKFHAAIIGREGLYGEPFALNMNKDLIETIVRYQTANSDEERLDIETITRTKFFKEENIVIEFYNWLAQNGMIDGVTEFTFNKGLPTKKVYLNVAGKNFATFDKVFLEQLPRWKQLIDCRNRILDPAILFVDWNEDEALPGLGLCKERAGVNGVVTHNALEDAIDVVEVLRTKYVTSKNK